jgi:hypothetical protein
MMRINSAAAALFLLCLFALSASEARADALEISFFGPPFQYLSGPFTNTGFGGTIRNLTSEPVTVQRFELQLFFSSGFITATPGVAAPLTLAGGASTGSVLLVSVSTIAPFDSSGVTGRLFAYGAGDVLLGRSELFGVSFNGAPIPTPEPATLLLLGAGLLGVAVRTRRRHRW